MNIADITQAQWAYFALHAAENNDLLMLAQVGAANPAAAVSSFNGNPAGVKQSILNSINAISTQPGFPRPPAAPPAPQSSNKLMWIAAAAAVYFLFIRKKKEVAE